MTVNGRFDEKSQQTARSVGAPKRRARQKAVECREHQVASHTRRLFHRTPQYMGFRAERPDLTTHVRFACRSVLLSARHRVPVSLGTGDSRRCLGVTTTNAARRGTAGWRADRLFYSVMAAAVILTVFCGFARTYYLTAWTGAPSLSPLVHVHGVVFTGWTLLFLAQTLLVAGGRTDLHRRLGTVGGGLAAAMIVLGYLTAVAGARRGFDGAVPHGTDRLYRRPGLSRARTRRHPASFCDFRQRRSLRASRA